MSEEMKNDVAMSEEAEVIEPQTDETDLGEEETEVTEQSSEQPKEGRSKADAAFAQMRREKEAAERELARIKAEQQARQNVLARLGGKDNADIEALAEVLGIDAEDVQATIESEQKQMAMEQRILELETEKRLDDTLAEIHALDPDVSEEDTAEILGYVDKGLTAEQGYYAVRAKNFANTPIAPKEIGKINSPKPMEKEFFTREEVNNMSEDDQRRNADKILASASKW